LPRLGEGLYDASPKALGDLPRDESVSAFTPKPVTLDATDILFDAWALTAIRDELPGRPEVGPYLHGLEDDDRKETQIAWREDVWCLREAGLTDKELTDLLDDYPLKPHELIRDSTYRKNTGVRDQLLSLANRASNIPVWIQQPDGAVQTTTTEALQNLPLAGRTVILPPEAGGLLIEDGKARGIFKGGCAYDAANRDCYDVADSLKDSLGNRLRSRARTVGVTSPPNGMRRVNAVRLRPELDEEEDGDQAAFTHYQYFTRPTSADDDQSKSSTRQVTWKHHTKQVVENIERVLERIPLPSEIAAALRFAAEWHDRGKLRSDFQRRLGNLSYVPGDVSTAWAKSNHTRPLGGDYRHEFGSLLEAQCDPAFLQLAPDAQELALHLIAAHHGHARPHFPPEVAFDPNSPPDRWVAASQQTPTRFARLQRKYGRWGLAFLESLLRAADWAASAQPSNAEIDKEAKP
jgi:CRISPR-associated endonuclease/helicase Cas3